MIKFKVNNQEIKVDADININQLDNILNDHINKNNNLSDQERRRYLFKWAGTSFVALENMNVSELKITNDNINKTFIDIFNEVGTNVNTGVDISNDVTNEGIYFKNSDLTIKFQKTLRVPDDGNKYPLPPNLGTFKLDQKDGSILLPMYQSEAMWINFNANKPCAVKVGVGNINAITGEKWQDGCLSQEPQNYLTCPEQYWLDGIKVNNINNKKDEYIVRQFVALPLDSEALIEKQLVDKGLLDKVSGGLKFIRYLISNSKSTVQ